MPRESNGNKSLLDHVPLILSVVALLFSMYQFLVYKDIDKEIKELTADSVQLDNDIKRLDLIEKEFRQQVQFENRYLVASEASVTTILDHTKLSNNFINSVVQNKVLDNFNELIEKVTDPSIGSFFQYTESIDFSTTAKHGLVILRIRNTSDVKANNVKLTIKWKDFPNSLIGELQSSNPSLSVADILGNNGNKFVNLWEIKDNNQDWNTETISIADIAPDGEVMIPLAHVLGTRYYFGRVIMPDQLQWDNPVLGKKETISVGTMVPTDQWLYTAEFGETFYVAQ